MKVGILTFHCAHNYGAVLQCFALQEYLKKIGHEVYVIDYRPDYLTKPYRPFLITNFFSKNPLKLLLKFITEPILSLLRYRRFDKFNNFIKTHLSLSQLDEETYDCVVCGSDQIWNPLITGKRFDPYYWGIKTKCNTIAYAASCGNYVFSTKESNELRSLLNKFAALSVREFDLQRNLSRFTKNPIQLVSDPVFLLDRDVWKTYCRPVKRKLPYLLCYNLNKSSECSTQADIICKKMGLERIDLTQGITLNEVRKNSDLTASPLDFISYFNEASFVVTSSFHGTAFSIIFQKPFITIGMKNRKGRVISLLSLLGLESYYTDVLLSDIPQQIDWQDTFQKGNNYILKSRDFLKTIL